MRLNLSGSCKGILPFVLTFLCGCGGGTQSESVRDVNTVKVFMGNNHLQCSASFTPLAQTEMLLIQGGIDVLQSHCAVVTGVAFPAVCGAGTGEINVHRIRGDNLPDAVRLGFKSVADIGVDPLVLGAGYQETACP